MYDHLLILVRGSPETSACFIVLSLLEKGKWIERLALRRIISALLRKKLPLTRLDEIMDECESFLDISYVSNCPLSLPRRSLCEIVRIKPRYHPLFKEKLVKVFKIMRIDTEALLSFYEKISPSFDSEDKNVCPKTTMRCFKSETTPSVVRGEPSRRYSIPQIKKMIRQRKIMPTEAFLYLPVDTQLIAIILCRLRKSGYVLVSREFISGFPDRITKEKWTDERIEKSIRPLEDLDLVARTGRALFRLLRDPPEQVFHIEESLEIEKRTREVLKRIRQVSASTGLDETLQNLKDVTAKFRPP